MTKGSLIVVGSGISLGAQCSAETRAWIKSADIVFSVLGSPIAQRWLESLNASTVSLQALYHSEPNRIAAYDAMVARILAAVREGKVVCAVFYGHPGVFVTPAHDAIRLAQSEGYEARMLPAISAEDCLFADLGVDPAQSGCQSYEARDFFFNDRRIDACATLILWQLAVLGDDSFTRLAPEAYWLKALAQALMEFYPAEHEVIIYEAAALPILQPKLAHLPLEALGKACISQASTLYVPPLAVPQSSGARRALMRAWADAEGRGGDS